MADPLTKDSVLKALKSVKAPSGHDIVTLGILSEIIINKDKVYFALKRPATRGQSL